MRGLNQRDTASVALSKAHNDLCKFHGKDDEDFTKIVQIFRRLEERRLQQTNFKGQRLLTNGMR